MTFSQVADKCFSWKLNAFKGKDINSLEEKSYSSPKFTTSVEPNREWKLKMTVKKQTTNCSSCARTARITKHIDMKLVYSENIPNPEDIKVEISIKNNVEKMTKSFIISGNNHEFGYDNFIDCETMLKMVQDGILEIVVELFLKIEENKNLQVFTNLEFLSDIQISIKGQKFHAHKVMLAKNSPYFLELFEHDKEIDEYDELNNFIKPETFKIILEYMYSDGFFNILQSDTEDVLLASNYLQIEDLKYDCENHIREKIAENTVCSILVLSTKSDAKFLMKHCLCYVLKNIHRLDFESLEKEPFVIMSILKEIFEQYELGRLTIVDNIVLDFKKEVNSDQNSLVQDYESFLNNERLSDLTIEIGKKTSYKCHKVILSGNSPVFCNMLISNMKEALTNVIKIKDIEPAVFYEVLRFIYTGKVENLKEYGMQILEAADRYNLVNLQKMCEEFLAEELTYENVLNFIENADKFNASFLLNRCSHYIVKQMISYPKMKKVKNVITLDMFVDCQNNIYYEFLNVLKNFCEILYISS